MYGMATSAGIHLVQLYTFTLFTLLELAAFWIFPPLLFPIIVSEFIFLFFITFFCRTFRYRIFSDQLTLLYGVFWSHRKIVPLMQIRCCSVFSTPLMRYHGICILSLSTVTGRLILPLLDTDEAAHLLQKIREVGR